MVNYAPVLPIQLLEQMQHEEGTAPYLMLLAHDVLAHKDRYGSWADKTSKGDTEHVEPFIIMDNSACELGTALDAEEVIEAAHVVGANIVVLPDVIGDGPLTCEVITEQHHVYENCGIPLMRIVQGANSREAMECAQWLKATLASDVYWGIPRIMTNNPLMGSRKPMIQYVNGLHYNEDDPKFHLFGMSNNLLDDLECCCLPGIMGIDSANPVVLGQQGKLLKELDDWEHVDRGSYWEHQALEGTSYLNMAFIQTQIDIRTV